LRELGSARSHDHQRNPQKMVSPKHEPSTPLTLRSAYEAILGCLWKLFVCWRI